MKHFTLFALVTFIGTNSLANYIETFNTSTSMADTYFSTTYISSAGQLIPHTMEGINNAPTSSLLPVSVGGDLELQYTGTGTSWATAPGSAGYYDSFISGYAGTALTSTFGSRYASLLTRASPNTQGLDAYVSSAKFGTFGHNTVSFTLQLMINGLRHADYISAISGSYVFDFTSENIYYEMSSVGDLISSSYWKVSSSGNKTFLTTLSFQDSTFSTGANGIGARAGGDKSVFIDDIHVEQIPEPSTISLLGLSAFSIFLARRKRQKSYISGIPEETATVIDFLDKW